MFKFLKIIFTIVIIMFVFSGCSSKIAPRNFALHKNTVQNIKKDAISLKVNNVKITGDAAPNVFKNFYKIEEEDIKTYLTKNINKFYKRSSSDKHTYKVDVLMDFEQIFKDKGVETIIDATYNIHVTNKGTVTINILSSYTSIDTVTFGQILGASIKKLFTGLDHRGEQNNRYFKFDSLEKTAYAEDDTVPLSAFDGEIRRETSYAGSIRLNFAQFLQKFNLLLNNQKLMIDNRL